jgi:hypothetical protein
MDVGTVQLYQAMQTVAATAAAIHRPLRSANRPRDDGADYADWSADYVADEKSWFSDERIEKRRPHAGLVPIGRSWEYDADLSPARNMLWNAIIA